MEFLAKTWGLWFVISMICCAYALFNQSRKMKKMTGSDLDDASNGFFKDTGSIGFFEGIRSMMLVGLAGLAGIVSFILFVIGVIAKLVLG